MSYDLDLFKPEPGIKLQLAVERWIDAQEEAEEINPGPPVPEVEAEKHRLVLVLRKVNPSLRVFDFGFEEIAAARGMSIQEARERFRHLELNGPDNSTGIQITTLHSCKRNECYEEF